MDSLVEAICRLVQTQHVDKISALASRVRNTGIGDAVMLSDYFNTSAANKALASVIENWQRVGCSSEELAGLLIGASYGYSTEREQEVVQLVWTGPDTNLVPVRRSAQVLKEIINSAKETLFIVSFVLVKVPDIESAISDAVSRGVDVRMLLESEDKDYSSSFRETVDRLREEIPGLTVYVWPREKREGTEGGFARVHAKCAVADENNAFVTSANLTSAALDKNIEMGVHIKGGSIPHTIHRQFVGLIRAEEIYPLSVIRDEKTEEPVATPIEALPVGLESGAEILVNFKNEKLDVDELRRFKVLSPDDEKPKANTVVLIRHENRWIVGKYAWSKQQDTEDQRNFYLVTVRGFQPTQKFEVEEQDWEKFKPVAAEAVYED